MNAASLYTYRRLVHWGDADPALIVYTVRFLDYAMEAVDGWFREILGIDWYRLNTEQHVGTPMVHVELDFASPLRPGDELLVRVEVGHIGRSSLKLAFRGATADGRPVYAGHLVLAFVDNQAMRSIAIPAALREKIEAYAAATREPA